MELFRRTFAEINIENLLHNWQVVQKIGGSNRFICPMVKANAYGHGHVEVSYALEREGANSLGVCLIEEGLELRASGIKTEILIFRGFDRRGAERIFESQMTPVVSTWEQLQMLEAVADESIKVHLKFNTGMNRLGFEVNDSEKLFNYFKKSKKLKLKALLTHLACSDDANQSQGKSSEQMRLFLEIQNFFKPLDIYSHVLNSGGIAALALAQSKNDFKNPLLTENQWGFRPGLMLYGYHSSEQFESINIKPVMSFKSVINNIRTLKKGETVSYRATWTAQRNSLIAIVPVGYADGFHRQISNRGHVLVAGQRVPIIGQVCMDFLMLDLTDLADSASHSNQKNWLNEEVILFGYDEQNNLNSAHLIANDTNTIAWEVLTSVGERVPRHFKGLKKS